MSKFLLLVATVFSLNSFSYGYVTIPGSCYVNQTQASCQVCNYTYRTLACTATAQAVSYRGFTYRNFGQGYVFPGQCMWVNVYARNPYWDLLRYANVFASCR